MNFKKCGSSDTEQEEKQGFEDDDTVVLVRVLCACQTPTLKTWWFGGCQIKCASSATTQCFVPHTFGLALA